MKRLAVVAVAMMASGCANNGYVDLSDFTNDELIAYKRSQEPKPSVKPKRRVVSRHTAPSDAMYPELYDTDNIKDYSKPNVSEDSSVKYIERNGETIKVYRTVQPNGVVTYSDMSQKTVKPELDWGFRTTPGFASRAWYGRFSLECSKSNEHRLFALKLDGDQIRKFEIYNGSSEFYGVLALQFNNDVKTQMRFENPDVVVVRGNGGIHLVVDTKRYDIAAVKQAMNKVTKSKSVTVVLETPEYRKEYQIESYKFRQQKPDNWNCKR